MPERNEHDHTPASEQALRKLFQAAGHHTPGTDITARIMAQVAVTPLLRPVVVKPLIGSRAWAVMAIGMLTLLVLVLTTGQGAPAEAPSALSPYAERFRNLLMPGGTWPVWTIGVSACALLFTLLDRALAKRVASQEEGA